MALRLLNTLSGVKEPFEPIHPGEARIYVCGPTVYNHLHIGNFRAFVVYDTLARLLASRGLAVKKVQNFTDVDDKTIRRAREEGVELPTLTARYIDSYHQDARQLNLLPQAEPRATEHIDGIIRHIQGLIEKGHAYEARGSVYFDVFSFDAYGALSKKPPEAMVAGARVEPEEGKRDPRDFALWKAARPGEPSWASPWGEGRPGWHIECSVMSTALLGVPFDIHGGGEDLIFPHHENELAQSQALTGRPLANIWLHNAMLTLSGEKMAKSQGNTFSVSSLLESYAPGALRLFLLSAHYRSPLAVDDESLAAAQSGYRRVQNVLRRLDGEAHGTLSNEGPSGEAWDAFQAFMDDDLNTAGAEAALFDLVRKANSVSDRGIRPAEAAHDARTLRAMLEILGIAEASETEEIDEDVLVLIAERTTARRERNFERADAIRDDLLSRGIQLEDTPGGVRWHRVDPS